MDIISGLVARIQYRRAESRPDASWWKGRGLFTPQNDAGNRAAFEVDARRRAQAAILRSYDQPTVKGWNYTENRRCTNPNCWCGQ